MRPAHSIDRAGVRFFDAVPALLHPIAFSGEDLDGIDEIVLSFDKAAVETLLPEGIAVQVRVQGEVTDIQW